MLIRHHLLYPQQCHPERSEGSAVAFEIFNVAILPSRRRYIRNPQLQPKLAFETRNRQTASIDLRIQLAEKTKQLSTSAAAYCTVKVRFAVCVSVVEPDVNNPVTVRL